MWQPIFKLINEEGAMHSFSQTIQLCAKAKVLSAVTVALLLLSNSIYAAPDNAERALARLMKDVQRLEPQMGKQTPHPQSKDGYYTTRPGDTVDMILLRVMPKMPVKKAIMRQALVNANPHAFKRKNPNWMYAGKRLRLPGAKDIHNVVFIQQADTKTSTRDAKLGWVKFP
jgi:Tfp pilus assembly protein FimV